MVSTRRTKSRARKAQRIPLSFLDAHVLSWPIGPSCTRRPRPDARLLRWGSRSCRGRPSGLHRAQGRQPACHGKQQEKKAEPKHAVTRSPAGRSQRALRGILQRGGPFEIGLQSSDVHRVLLFAQGPRQIRELLAGPADFVQGDARRLARGGQHFVQPRKTASRGFEIRSKLFRDAVIRIPFLVAFGAAFHNVAPSRLPSGVRLVARRARRRQRNGVPARGETIADAGVARRAMRSDVLRNASEAREFPVGIQPGGVELIMAVTRNAVDAAAIVDRAGMVALLDRVASAAILRRDPKRRKHERDHSGSP